MTEHEKARHWRERLNMKPYQLGEMIGYSKEAVWAMERGEATPSRGRPKRAVDPKVWRRYKSACAAVDAWFKYEHNFDW